MKKLLSTLAIATVLTTSAQAGAVVDIKAGFDFYPGVVPSGSVAGTDIVTGVGIDSSSQSAYYIEFEHLIPVIPNIKFEDRKLDFTGTATVAIAGTGIVAGASQFAWNHQDLAFYWGVPFSTWVPMIDAADVGFGLKLGNLTTGVEGATPVEFPVGAFYGYGRLHVTPPMLFGIGFEYETKYMDASYNGATLNFSENIFKIDWMIEAPIPVIDLAVGLEFGYKATSLLLTVNSVGFDLGFNGIFFGVVGKFGI